MVQDVCGVQLMFVGWMQLGAALGTHATAAGQLSALCEMHEVTYQVHAQPCMQGSGDAACLLCMLGAVNCKHARCNWASVSVPHSWAAASLCSLHRAGCQGCHPFDMECCIVSPLAQAAEWKTFKRGREGVVQSAAVRVSFLADVRQPG
jgi:hypothetical protein